MPITMTDAPTDDSVDVDLSGVCAAPTETPPLIEVRDLVKCFGPRRVLDGVNLTVQRGETVVVIGGSGSGKSTFARLLVGLDRPTAGHILVDGVDMTELGDRALTRFRRRFAMVFQNHALLDSMTLFENVAFPLREETDLDERQIETRVITALEELGLEPSADKFPGELSGGMAKRAGIARAIVVEPEILVYDEPTSGLDPVSSRAVDALIERMREQHLVTSIVITHDMMTAYDVADRLVLLAGGRIAADGDPRTLLDARSAEVFTFAAASGIDVSQPGPRRARTPPSVIRSRWDAAHPAPR